MSDSTHQDMDDLLEVTEIHHKEQRVLSRLLGDLRSQASHHLVLQVRMGDVSSYLMSVTLRWVAEKVGFAADLPIFRESSEGSKRIQVDPETVEKIQQRPPDWRRQLDMAVYLATRRHHKFPPLLLVGYQGWVYDDRNDKWGTDARAMNDSLTLSGLEPTGTYWDLDDSDTQFYALDGQHRLMAILGLREIVQTGQLACPRRKAESQEERTVPRGHRQIHTQRHGGEPRDYPRATPGISSPIRPLSALFARRTPHKSRDDIPAVLLGLQHLDERIGIEIVPAVRTEENLGEALRRLRQMFVDVNENAKPLSRSEAAYSTRRDQRLPRYLPQTPRRAQSASQQHHRRRRDASQSRRNQDKTNSSSSFTTRFCGKGAIPILRCRSSTRRRHCIPTYGCAASTVGSTVPTTGLPERSDCYTTLNTLAEIVRRYLKETRRQGSCGEQ